jgi:hypothetical protein
MLSLGLVTIPSQHHAHGRENDAIPDILAKKLSFACLAQKDSEITDHVLNDVGRVDSGLVLTVQAVGADRAQSGARRYSSNRSRAAESPQLVRTSNSSVSSFLESAGMFCLQVQLRTFCQSIAEKF